VSGGGNMAVTAAISRAGSGVPTATPTAFGCTPPTFSRYLPACALTQHRMSHVTCHMSHVAPHAPHPSSQLRMQTAACKLEQLGYQGRVDDELRGRQLQVTGGACRLRDAARADVRVMQRAHVAVQPAVPNVVQSAGGA
jgi:hypothetical protein